MCIKNYMNCIKCCKNSIYPKKFECDICKNKYDTSKHCFYRYRPSFRIVEQCICDTKKTKIVVFERFIVQKKNSSLDSKQFITCKHCFKNYVHSRTLQYYLNL